MNWLKWKIRRKEESGVVAHEIYAKITSNMHFSEYSLKSAIEDALIRHYRDQLIEKFSD